MTDLVVATDFKEKVTSKVRDTFMDLIPEETLNELVQKEINDFFNVTSEKFRIVIENRNFGYSNSGSASVEMMVSPFRALVWEEVKSLVMPSLKKIFESENWKTEVAYDNMGKQEVRVSELLDAKLEQYVTVMAKAMFQQAFGAAVEASKMDIDQQVVNKLQQNGINAW